MSQYVLPIVLAIIAGSGIPMYLIQRFDRNNTKQHEQNLSVLKEIQSDVHDLKEDTREVKSQLNRHFEWHLTGEKDNEPSGRTRGKKGRADLFRS